MAPLQHDRGARSVRPHVRGPRCAPGGGSRRPPPATSSCSTHERMRAGTADSSSPTPTSTACANWFTHHTGIALSDAKRELVYSRLARRLRKLKLATFGDYCSLVESGDAGGAAGAHQCHHHQSDVVLPRAISFRSAGGRGAAARRRSSARRRGGCACGRPAAPPARSRIPSPSCCARRWRTCATGTCGCSPPTSIRRWWRRPHAGDVRRRQAEGMCAARRDALVRPRSGAVPYTASDDSSR